MTTLTTSTLNVHCNQQVINICAAAAAKSLLSCPTLCDPIDSSSPGSPIPGILQARTLDWVTISFSINICRSIQIKGDHLDKSKCAYIILIMMLRWELMLSLFHN